MNDDKGFDDLLAKFDEQMKQFFRKAKRGRRLLSEVSAESQKRYLKSQKNESSINSS